MFASLPSDLLRPSPTYDAAATQEARGANDQRTGGVQQQKQPERGSLQTLLEAQLRQGPNGMLVGALLNAIREMPANEAAERTYIVKMLDNTGGFKLTPREKALVLDTFDKHTR